MYLFQTIIVELNAFFKSKNYILHLWTC